MTQLRRPLWLLLLAPSALSLGGCFSVSSDCELFYNCAAAGSGGASGPGGAGGGGAAGAAGGSTPGCGDGRLDPDEQCDDGNMVDSDECAACQVRGADCATPVDVPLVWAGGGSASQVSVKGSTAGGGNHTSGLCASAGPDRVFRVTVSAEFLQIPVLLTASLARGGTTFQSVLVAVKDACDLSRDGLCADSRAPAGQPAYHGGEVLSFPVTHGDVWYFFVDGEGQEDAGDYLLTLGLSTGDDCSDPVPLVIEPSAGTSPVVVTGSTEPPHGNASNASAACSDWGLAEDVVYSIHAKSAGFHTFELQPSTATFDATLFVQNECGDTGSELDCAESAGDAGTETISRMLVQDEILYLWVDGKWDDDKGSFTLVITPPPG